MTEGIKTMEKPVISVITPVFNEEECLPAFYERVVPIMEKIGLPFEIIAVDDGSRDKSLEIISEHCKKDKRLKCVSFSRNFGQQAAFFCGLENCSGDAAILIDADLQDPPEIFPEMIAKWREGYDVVHGVRRVRKKESLFKKASSAMWINLTRKLSDLDIPKNVGEFKLYGRKVIDAIIALPERSRSLRTEVAWVGFKQTSVEFDRSERKAGETKFTLKKMIRFAEQSTIPYSPKVLKLSGKVGVFGAVLSVIAFIAFIVLAATGNALPLTAWLFPAIALTGSAVLISNGITDIYLAYLYEDVKNRPIYIPNRKINLGEDEENG